MKTSTWLRTAAVLTGLLALGHTLGRPWTPIKTPEAAAAVAAMREVHFAALGVTRSYFEFYEGFGLCISAFAFMVAGLLWRQADAARAGRPVDRAMILIELAGFVAMGAVSARFIFAVPAAFNAAIAIALAGAAFASRPSPAAP
jgi:formate-dependent nitrite reductase membrane component NrfD